MSDRAGRRRLAGHAGRNWKFPARNECRGLPGDCRQVRLRQRSHHAGGLHRAQRSGDRGQTLGHGGQGVARDERCIVCGERIDIVEIHHRGAVIHGGAEIDAHLFDDVPPHFGDGDLQHHLIAAADDDGVDDLVGATDQPCGDIAGLLGLDRTGYRACQHDAIADTFGLDSRRGQHLLQRGANTIEIALDRDVIGRDLLSLGVEEHDVGLPHGLADDIGALRRADHRVGNLGIGDQHILDVARQVDDHRFADAEREKAHLRLSWGGGQHRGIARHHRRQRRIKYQPGYGRK